MTSSIPKKSISYSDQTFIKISNIFLDFLKEITVSATIFYILRTNWLQHQEKLVALLIFIVALTVPIISCFKLSLSLVNLSEKHKENRTFRMLITMACPIIVGITISGLLNYNVYESQKEIFPCIPKQQKTAI
ncbi:hypothetical protein [Zymobacter palmae]|uniref:hypothetical protein n=1 Tax=Zymobacter palmae TaxID=33074 RepID=UPI0011AE6488|nr:hypothetical protein [Zymobacter palmae]